MLLNIFSEEIEPGINKMVICGNVNESFFYNCRKSINKKNNFQKT